MILGVALMIEIIYEENNHQSLALDGETLVGECIYEIREDDKWYILHTRVRSDYGGQGIAKKLVLRIIEEARKANKKIVPICSYAYKMMVDNKDYEDVL